MTQKTYDNLQDLFNDIYTRMLAQGEPCRKAPLSTKCVYRNYAGHGCAIGIVLSDLTIQKLNLLETNPAIYPDGYTLRGRGTVTQVVRALLPNYDLKTAFLFCSRMQACHDKNHANKERWLNEFKLRAAFVAKEFNLSIP